MIMKRMTCFNKLSEIPNLPQRLEVLSINNNKLNTIDDSLQTQRNIITQDLSSNRLRNVDRLVELCNIRVLLQKVNKITSIKKQAEIKGLIELDVDTNRITDMADVKVFENHPTIHVQNIANNAVLK